MYAFVKWQSSEFVVTSEKECRPVDNRIAKKKKQTTQIAWYILFETDFSSFSLLTLLLQLHSITIRLLFLFVMEFFFRVSLHHSHKIRFFLCIFHMYTRNIHNRNQLRNSILCHIAFCLFISLFVSFSAWLNYLMCKTYTAEYTEMSCVVKPKFDMHLILLN